MSYQHYLSSVLCVYFTHFTTSESTTAAKGPTPLSVASTNYACQTWLKSFHVSWRVTSKRLSYCQPSIWKDKLVRHLARKLMSSYHGNKVSVWCRRIAVGDLCFGSIGWQILSELSGESEERNFFVYLYLSPTLFILCGINFSGWKVYFVCLVICSDLSA